MNGPIAQLVSLTCHGNAFLRGTSVAQFFPGNSTCRFCDRVSFVELRRRLFGRRKTIELAGRPDAWFEYLKRSGARGIRLRREERNEGGLPDRIAAGFVGGGGAWT